MISTAILITRRCVLVLQTLFIDRTQSRLRIRYQTRSIHRGPGNNR
jgi:hypothetical protein